MARKVAAAPKKTAPKKTAPKKTAPKKTAPRSTGYQSRAEALISKILKLPGEAVGFLDRIEGMLKSAERAKATYIRDHWGQKPPRGLVNTFAADPGTDETLPVLGTLYAVTYQTRKGEDATQTLYEHKFAKTRPLLCYSPKQGGLLIIAGGQYTVTERGIEG